MHWVSGIDVNVDTHHSISAQVTTCKASSTISVLKVQLTEYHK